jgi:hypothetical protein
MRKAIMSLYDIEFDKTKEDQQWIKTYF